jgi:hypothetical protein
MIKNDRAPHGSTTETGKLPDVQQELSQGLQQSWAEILKAKADHDILVSGANPSKSQSRLQIRGLISSSWSLSLSRSTATHMLLRSLPTRLLLLRPSLSALSSLSLVPRLAASSSSSQQLGPVCPAPLRSISSSSSSSSISATTSRYTYTHPLPAVCFRLSHASLPHEELTPDFSFLVCLHPA